MPVVHGQTNAPEAVVRSPRPIVVGTDGSRWGDAALLWAAEHAWRSNAELDVWTVDSGADLPADDVLDRVTSAYPELHVRVHRSGVEPVRQLTTAGVDAGVLVIGHRGWTAGPFGLGALVLPLVNAATCDLVVVRGNPSAVRGDNHRVTALISGRADDEPVLRRASAVAALHGSALRVVHAVPVPIAGAAIDPDHGFVRKDAERLLRRLTPRTRCDVVVLRVQPYEVVTRYSDNDLLVVGTGDHTADTRRSGSVTRMALHHAPCPVLVVRRPHTPAV